MSIRESVNSLINFLYYIRKRQSKSGLCSICGKSTKGEPVVCTFGYCRKCEKKYLSWKPKRRYKEYEKIKKKIRRNQINPIIQCAKCGGRIDLTKMDKAVICRDCQRKGLPNV